MSLKLIGYILYMAFFKTFVVHWSGPYTILQIANAENYEKNNGLYLLTGKCGREKTDQIQYCGITTRRYYERVNYKHRRVVEIRRPSLSIWIGQIVYPESFTTEDLKIAERCFTYFWKPNLNELNVTHPPKQVCFVSQWFNCKNEPRLHRPSLFKEVPDVLWWDEERWRTGKLRIWPKG